jgi:hypothetical protein
MLSTDDNNNNNNKKHGTRAKEGDRASQGNAHVSWAEANIWGWLEDPCVACRVSVCVCVCVLALFRLRSIDAMTSKGHIRRSIASHSCCRSLLSAQLPWKRQRWCSVTQKQKNGALAQAKRVGEIEGRAKRTRGRYGLSLVSVFFMLPFFLCLLCRSCQ